MTDDARSPYYFSPRHDMIELIPGNTQRILEVGCAGGATGKELKERGVKETVGIGDVETIDLPYERGHFDCILYGDVLEHLKDPWHLLARHNRIVRHNGMVIISVPNIRHYRVVKKLVLKGEWKYTDDGIMDRTHLRFFTLGSTRDMIESAGFEIQAIIKKPSGAGWLKGLNTLSGNRLIEFLVRQYIISARKIREV